MALPVVAGNRLTARDIIVRAYRRIGKLGSAEELSAEDAANGLEILQGMIDAWQIKRLVLTHIQRFQFPLVAGQISYTVGRSDQNDFVLVRPVFTDRVALVEQPSSPTPREYPMEPMSLLLWTQSKLTTRSGGRPGGVYFDGAINDVGNELSGTMYLDRAPTRTYAIAFYLGQPLSNFSELNDENLLPPGYNEAIRFNLAVRLAGDLGRAVDRDLGRQARESLSSIKAANTQSVQSDTVREIEPLFTLDTRGGGGSFTNFFNAGI